MSGMTTIIADAATDASHTTVRPDDASTIASPSPAPPCDSGLRRPNRPTRAPATGREPGPSSRTTTTVSSPSSSITHLDLVAAYRTFSTIADRPLDRLGVTRAIPSPRDDRNHRADARAPTGDRVTRAARHVGDVEGRLQRRAGRS